MAIPAIRLGNEVRQSLPLIDSFKSRLDPAFREIRPSFFYATSGIPVHTDLVKEYSLAFADHIDKSPDRTLRSIMGAMQTTMPDLGSLSRFADAIERGSSGFSDISSYLAYQGLLWAIRCVPKTDCHVHISNNLHESEIAEIMIKHPDLIDKMIGEMNNTIREKHEEKIREYVKKGDKRLLALTLKHCFEYESGYDADFVVVSDGIIRETVEITCKRFFEDGVFNFDIRFNPFKKAIRNYGDNLSPAQWQEIAKSCVDAVKAGIESAKQECGYPAADIGMIFSFNRAKSYSMAMHAFDLYKEDEMLKGIDVAGDEIEVKGQDLQPSVWGDLFKDVRESGRYTTAHLDFRITRKIGRFKDGIDQAKRDGIGSPAFNGFLNMSLLSYLPFAEGFIDILCKGSEAETGASGIGHGYILNPDYLITPLWDAGILDIDRTVICSLPDGARILERIEQMRRKVIDNGIIVEHNPPAMFRDHNDIPTYSHSFVNNMIGQGFDLRIGTDAGVFSFNRPRTLSEAIVRVLVSAPKDSTLTVAAALRAAGVHIYK